jgi:hypothetical protein
MTALAKIQPRYLRLTEELNALDFFEKTVIFLRETDKSDVAWKWVVIGLHGALYGFAVSACHGTDSSSVVENDHLISFDEAVKRCVKGRAGNPLVLSPKERESVRWLQKILRNRFEHYRPCRWSIELHGFPTLALNCVRVIETLATETSRSVHLNREQRAHLKQLAEEAKSIIRDSKLQAELRIKGVVP